MRVFNLPVTHHKGMMSAGTGAYSAGYSRSAMRGLEIHSIRYGTPQIRGNVVVETYKR